MVYVTYAVCCMLAPHLVEPLLQRLLRFRELVELLLQLLRAIVGLRRRPGALVALQHELVDPELVRRVQVAQVAACLWKEQSDADGLDRGPRRRAGGVP